MTLEEIEKDSKVVIEENSDMLMTDNYIIFEVGDKVYAFRLTKVQQQGLMKRLEINEALERAKKLR